MNCLKCIYRYIKLKFQISINEGFRNITLFVNRIINDLYILLIVRINNKNMGTLLYFIDSIKNEFFSEFNKPN